jgi:GNAT superfamily N-acetyltransferase
MASDSPQANGTSGSPRAAAAAGPNVDEVVFGSLPIRPWYPSFYPEELVGRRVDRLYVCQWCFKYTKELTGFIKHLVSSSNIHSHISIRVFVFVRVSVLIHPPQRACRLRSAPPPGIQIYAKDNYSLYEIDGEKHKLYAQNLCLFAKLFLDTKSVFYDVTTFLYYLLVAHSPAPAVPNTRLDGDPATDTGATDTDATGTNAAAAAAAPENQVVGFFSKEKMSWDNNNLACILVFPPWQKQGLGQMLMGASYEMSKRQGRLGGPEKRTFLPFHIPVLTSHTHMYRELLLPLPLPLPLPIFLTLTPQPALSDLGHLAYAHYWAQTLARTLLSSPAKKPLSVLELRDRTYITPDDIIATLQDMGVLEQKKRGGADVVINKAKVRAWVEARGIELRSPVDPDAFALGEGSRSGSEA